MSASNNSLVLRPKPLRKWWWVALGSGAFTAIGFHMIRSGNDLGWFVGGFFGLCLFGSFAMFLPGASYLKLEANGFTVCTFWRKQHYRWDAVSAFGVTTIAHNRFVAFDFIVDEDRPKGASINVAISGAESSLPDTYGMRADALATLMNEWRERALSAPDRP